MAILDNVGKVLVSARLLLQDSVEPYRYPNEHLISVLNDAVLEAARIRPDLFLGSSLPEFTSIDGAFTSVEAMYRPAFVYYVAGKAQLVDDEISQDQRATVLMNKFVSQLLTVAA